MKQQKITIHWILGGALLLIGLFVIIALVLTRSQGAAPSTSLTVTASAPSVDTIKLCSTTSASPTSCSHVTTGVGLTLTSGTTTPYQIAGTISDVNGWSDIITFQGSFYRTSQLSASCDTSGEATSAPANCYYGDDVGAGGCTLTSTSATAGYFDCDLAVNYYSTATSADAVTGEQGVASDTWTVQGYVEDTGLLNDTGTALTEVNSLRAIETDEGNACATIAYGSLANGSATSDSSLSGTDCVLENAGNVDTDVSESGTNMSCTFGSVAIANQRVNVASGTYASMASGGTDLTVSAQNVNVALDKTSSTTKSTDSLFHAISVPSTGASGACTGTNTILAISEVI